MEQTPEKSQENAQEALDNLQTHEPAIESIPAAQQMPEINDRIYLKSPFRETHIEMQVVEVEEELNPATQTEETAFTFLDGSKLFQSDLDTGGYSWAKIPETPSGIDGLLRDDENEEA